MVPTHVRYRKGQRNLPYLKAGKVYKISRIVSLDAMHYLTGDDGLPVPFSMRSKSFNYIHPSVKNPK